MHQEIPRHQRERCQKENLVAVSTDVLIGIVKKELQLKASLYTLLQIFSVSVFEKTEISCALQLDPPAPEMPIDANQLGLFES